MGTLSPASAAGLVGGLVLVIAAETAAFEGRYVGSLYHTPGRFSDENQMRHLFDVGTRSTVYGGADLRLWMNLSYSSRPGMSGTELLQGRVSADLRKSIFRIHGQIEPWQDSAPGASPPRKRNLTFGLDVSPRNGPRLLLNWSRADRASSYSGRSSIEDGRVRLDYGWSGGGAGLGYRRLESGVAAGGPERRILDEWRADISKNWNWRRVSVLTAYDGQYTRTSFRDRETTYFVNRLNLGGRWVPTRRLLIGGSAIARLGTSEDNAVAADRDIDERFLSGRARYIVFEGFDLSLIREYRTRDVSAGASADYWQAQAQFRRDLIRGMGVHAGVSRTQDLVTSGGNAPKNSSFLIVDGWIRKALAARIELRAAWLDDIRFIETQWRRLAQLRMVPGPATRLEITWHATSEPRVGETSQNDRAWEFLVGYRPMVDLDLSLTYRTLEGTGRVERSERYGSITSTWRLTPAANLAVNWSRRKAATGYFLTDERVAGVELRFRLPRRFQVRGNWRHLAGISRPTTDTYGLVLEKRF